jgi:hypothetical protein
LFNINHPDNNEQSLNFSLLPFDVINIRKMAVYEKPEMVMISGAVNYAGKYVLLTSESLRHCERAGGLTSG